MLRTLRRGALALFPVAILTCGLTPARGAFLATVSATVTNEPGALYFYNYTVSTASASTGSTSDFSLNVNAAANLTGIAAPSGFDIFYVTGGTTLEFQSSDPSTDIMPGTTGSFSFTSVVGPASGTDVLRNIDDVGGTFTDLAGTVLAPVPEPASLVLYGVGAAALILATRRRRVPSA